MNHCRRADNEWKEYYQTESPYNKYEDDSGNECNNINGGSKCHQCDNKISEEIFKNNPPEHDTLDDLRLTIL